MGEELAVWVKLNDGHQLTEEDVRRFCKGKVELDIFTFSHLKQMICFSAVTFQDSKVY